MKIDNDDVVLNDKVWHDRYGWGSVIKVTSSTIEVKFNESISKVVFTEGGYSNGYKVLWWSPPMLYTPRKGIDYSALLPVVAELIKFKYGVE